MEWWSLAVGNVAFFDDQRVDPIAGLLLAFEAFDQLQESVLKFESQIVEGFEILLADLLSFMISI